MDRVVPVAVKAMPLEAYRRQLRIGDGDAGIGRGRVPTERGVRTDCASSQ